MEKEEQFKLFREILEKFQSTGVLQEIMLIGSWCLYFYRIEFEKTDALPAIRTLDVDFLIPDKHKLTKEVDVPALLKEMGFVSTYNRRTGLVVYDHPELRVEFLIPELGRGFDKPQDIKKLHVKAQGLRYLNLLTEYPRVISDGSLRVRVPEPAVFALHKLIISARRLNKEKAKKDLESAVGLLDFLYSKPSEISRIKSILRTIPGKWLKTILTLSEKHYPRLNQTAHEV